MSGKIQIYQSTQFQYSGVLKYVSLQNRRIITGRRNCMADESQLSLFKQGVRAWNEWRREHQREIFEEQVDRLIRALSSEEHGSCRHRLNYNIVTTALRRRIDWLNPLRHCALSGTSRRIRCVWIEPRRKLSVEFYKLPTLSSKYNNKVAIRHQATSYLSKVEHEASFGLPSLYFCKCLVHLFKFAYLRDNLGLSCRLKLKGLSQIDSIP